nr:hypothetical protein [Treponema sp.]
MKNLYDSITGHFPEFDFEKRDFAWADFFTAGDEEVENWIKWNLDNYQKYGFGLWAVCLKESNGMKFAKAFTKTVMGKLVEDEVLYMKDL